MIRASVSVSLELSYVRKLLWLSRNKYGFELLRNFLTSSVVLAITRARIKYFQSDSTYYYFNWNVSKHQQGCNQASVESCFAVVFPKRKWTGSGRFCSYRIPKAKVNYWMLQDRAPRTFSYIYLNFVSTFNKKPGKVSFAPFLGISQLVRKDSQKSHDELNSFSNCQGKSGWLQMFSRVLLKMFSKLYL